jgi:Calcineurin-like phosphoesterase
MKTTRTFAPVTQGRTPASGSRRVRVGCQIVTAAALAVLSGCAHVGRLALVAHPLTPADTTGGHHPERATIHSDPMHGLFGRDTLIGFMPGTGDSSRRYFGRLRTGYTADTINFILLGDNRPDFRSARLAPEFVTIRRGLSPNPLRIGLALVTIPWAFVKGMFPDLGLIRDIPSVVRQMPTFGREHQVMSAILAKVDTLNSQHQRVAAVINTGDLVADGRRPDHWKRFLRLAEPLATRAPYVAIPGNHEQTWTSEGVENWRTATGLPVAGDRLYYCFDSADGWVRFIAFDTNPITHPGVHWSREVQIKYSKEEVDWLTKRLKEHRGPSFVFMHSPPFSAGYHRMEWEDDPVMRARRDQIVQAMRDGGISILASGHDHDYQRALLTWPDGSVLVVIVQGGGGAPLHPLPPPAEAARVFSTYKSAGATIKPENVYTGEINNFSFLRLWFGGGELQTFAVQRNGSTSLVDKVSIDLQRYGVPKIDQKKIPIAATAPVRPSSMEVKEKAGVTAKTDTTAASKRIQSQPAPGKKKPRKRVR